MLEVCGLEQSTGQISFKVQNLEAQACPELANAHEVACVLTLASRLKPKLSRDNLHFECAVLMFSQSPAQHEYSLWRSP